MAGLESKTARQIAAEALCEAELRQQFASEILNNYPQLTERQRATDLVFGVLRNQVVIDLVIEKVSTVSVERIAAKILNIVRVALYELIYCPQAAEYAIVDEAVDYAKHIANAKQAGFVNAVLRQTLRHINSRQISLEQSPLRKAVPQTPGTGCEFSIELFPDRDESPVEYLSIAFSLPDWLVESWLAEYGLEQTGEICFASNRRPSIYLRPNILRTTVDGLVEKLQSEGVQCETVAEVDMIRVDSPGAIAALPGFSEGLFTVQDISIAAAVRLLQPKPDWSILDLCAAPGTKTTQLVEATGGRAEIVATDIAPARLEVLRDGMCRLGLSKSVTVIAFEELQRAGSRWPDGFDCVLLDVPCSNTGVLARRPEVRYRLTRIAIEGLADTQLRLLRRAKELVKPGGVICYSTCSIQPDENGFLVGRFLADNSDSELKLEKLTLPSAEGFDHDGGYVVIIANEAGAL
jgi:16S rRNA (cytosine967-C5)-methyltransferase